MRTCLRFTVYLMCLSSFFLFCNIPHVFSEVKLPENFETSLTTQPVQYIFVDGDAARFQTHHWMQEGYTGGIKNFSAEYGPEKGITVETEGHALIDINDYEALVSVEKEDLWELMFYYQEFQKFFDDTGGTYYPFGAQALGTMNSGYKRELSLDLGKIEVEFEINPPNLPEMLFFYEHHFKNGTKNRLTWGTVTVGGVSRKIAPSYQEVVESVDTFLWRAEEEIAGFHVSVEPEIELFGAESMRVETQGNTDTIRRQTQKPRALMVASTFEIERWFWKDRARFSSGYRISHINNDEFESLAELGGDYRLKGGSHGRVNAIAENDLDTHTWVASFLVDLKEWLSTTTKFKAEQFRHKGHSVYPYDTTAPPDGIPNSTQISDVLSKGGRFGESFSVRFTKIPRTALYNELEFEQSRLNMREDRTSIAGQSTASADEIFGRDTLTTVQKGSWTLGAHVQPVPAVDVTSQVRYRADSSNYDDRRETAPGGSAARSAFFDGQFRDTSEFMTRVSYKAFRLLQPSFRYQLQGVEYATRTEGMPIVETSTISHIYTFDATSNPLDELLLTGSFSRQTYAVKTPASLYSTTGNLPTFNADVDSWLFSGSYSFSEDLVATSALVYSFSDNFNDFTSIALPLGVDDQRLDVTAGLVWTVNEYLSVEPKYAYYHYQANTNADAGGDYNAHLISFEATVAWG